MSSLYLNRLTHEDFFALKKRLFETQNGKCFICNESIDIQVHGNELDIDHIIPTSMGGRDDPINFALAHASCNRSKQAANLEVARVIHRFDDLKNDVLPDNRSPNLEDVLKKYNGAKYQITLIKSNNYIRYSLNQIGNPSVIELPVYKDELSGFEYFFTKLPIEYLYHDDKINPRSIGQNVGKLIQEFYQKRPQLHPSLAWVEIVDDQPTQIKIFDGQHKAAAQILLGVRDLPVRVFINPDLDILLKTNMNAGTTLRQVAFDLSIRRYLGNSLYIDRIERYRVEHELSNEDFSFSEIDIIRHFKGEARELKRYILDSVRDSIIRDPDNKLADFIDFGGRQTERPLSYSTIDKTFFSFFIYQEVLETPLDYKFDEGENPRELEKEQILHLMNIIAEEIYVGKFNSEIGTRRIESRIQNNEDLPLNHVRAYRLSKEEVIHNWLRYVDQITRNFFIMQGKPVNEKKLFQYKFPQPLWEIIRIFIRNLFNLPVWANNSLSATVFGGKQNYDFWQSIFESGKSPQGVQVLTEPLNLMKMIHD